MPGPSNLYGVANPVALPVTAYGVLTGSAAAGVNSPIFSNTTLVAPSSGWFYPVCWLSYYVGWISPLPTDFHVYLTVNGGSGADVLQIDTALMTVSAWTMYGGALFGTPSNTLWTGAGSVVNIAVQPTTNPVNIRGYSNKAVYALFRAPDQ